MNRIITGLTCAFVLVMLGGCGGGGDDADTNIEMETGNSASDIETISPTTGEPVVAETLTDSINIILGSKGRPLLSDTLCPEGTGFNGCYATECLSYLSDLGFSSTLRDVFIITDTEISAVKVVYESDDCSGNILLGISSAESRWSYSYTSMSDNRAVVSGSPLSIVSAAGIESGFTIPFTTGYALWELEDSMNRFCLSGGPESDLEIMKFSPSIEEMGTSTTGACATRLSLAE